MLHNELTQRFLKITAKGKKKMSRRINKETDGQLHDAYPLAEADNRPEGAPQSAAAAHTSTEQPSHVHRQSLLKNGIYTHYSCFKLLRGNT